MARIALIDPSGRAATTVEAVLGGAHEIVVRTGIHAPGDVDLVIADLRYADLADQGTLRSLVSFAPVLLLVDRKDPVPTTVAESDRLTVLRKPFDPFELRLRVERLLKRSRASAAPAAWAMCQEEDDAGWLEFPYVSAPAGAMLRRAARLSTPLWILGEPGSGKRRIAIAVCREAHPSTSVVTLFPDERLHEIVERESKRGRFVLIVPEIEERPLIEQERLAALLAGPRGFRLIATSVEDPAERVVAGTFSRNLYRQLDALAVQISPLREQPIAIPPLTQALARRIARSLGIHSDLSFTPEAMSRIQSYMWPGNLTELEAVLTRTLVAIPDEQLTSRPIEADEILFVASETARSRAARGAREPRNEAPRPAPPRPVRPSRPEPAAARPAEAPEASAGVSFETVVAGLAHDLRNPMTTIKTFAGAISSGRFEGDTARELGERVSAECDRLNACLSELERYSSLARPALQRIDAVTVVREVVQSLEPPAMRRILIAPVGSAWVEADPEQMRFVVDNLVAAALGELPEGQRLLIDAGNERVITLSVPAPGGPVTRLRKIVEGQEQEPSWRIVLARTVAARNGCKVEVSAAGEAMTIRLVLRGGEVGSRGQQTGRTDR